MGSSFGFGLNINTTGLGLNQGLNVQQTVAALVTAAEEPEQTLKNQEQVYTSQQSVINNINTLLGDLQTAVQALQDPLGGLAATAATSSNTSVLTGTTTTGAAVGAHTVTVTSLATTSAYDTNALASSTTTISPGSFTLKVGSGTPVVINVSAANNNDTLNSLAAYINAQGDGVTASVITDVNGARLGLVSGTSGAPGDLTVSSNSTSLVFNKTVTGANSSINVDGVPLNTSSNTVSGAIPGVTLNLVGTSATPVTLTVGANSNQVSTTINNFVSAYNAVIQAVNTQFTYTQGASSQPPLFSDSSLQMVQQTLYTDVNYTIGGSSAYTTLASMGVTLQQDGTLQVDNGTLNSAINANSAAVQNFFQQSTGANGFAINFGNDLTNLTNVTSGPLYLDLQGVNQNQQDLQNQINQFQANVNQEATLWLQEYAQVNSLLQTLPLELQQLNSQLGSLGGSSASSSSQSSSAPSGL
ncbi:MAG: flagellar filament capping protein FliD [Acidobacteriota bacterium]|nr:flagellar filament capping protein FliD [Acidobacteriota bacterium]